MFTIAFHPGVLSHNVRKIRRFQGLENLVGCRGSLSVRPRL